MAIVKYKVGTLTGFTDGFEQDYKLHLYKDTVLDPDGEYSDFTEATGTGYSIKTLLWSAATVAWDAVEEKYAATWAAQEWTNVSGLDANGWFISDSANTVVYAAEEKTLGEDYTTLSISPKILMG